MTRKITPYKLSLHSDEFMIIIEPTDFDPKSQQVLVSLDNKVVEGVYNPVTKNITAKITSHIHKTYDVLEDEFIYNPLRIKVFAYDFEKEKIVDAKLQEFLFNPQSSEYAPLDKLLTTSPMIISKWKKRLHNKIFVSNNLTDNLEIDSKFYCTHCEEELTLELLKSTTGLNKLSSKQTLIINSVLPFINLYRKNFGLDTCLKKAHFVAQIAHESKKFSTLEEDETYSSNITLGEFSKNSIEINETILESLKDHLTSIFSITDLKDKELTKTSDEIKNILLDKKPKIIDGELYGYFLWDLKKGKSKKDSKPKLILEVLKEDKSVDYKVFIKQHKHFGVPLLSRAYGNYPKDDRGLGNGDELSRDGWKFKGRGLKQVTGRGNYKEFSEYRKKNKFTDDESGYVDFTAEKENESLKGNYLKLSDEYIYATQSAFWFWNSGTGIGKKNKKYAVDFAEEDNFDKVCECINKNDKDNKPKRKDNYNRARKVGVFDINRHYKLMAEGGTDAQKKAGLEYLEKRKAAGDKEAEKILEEYYKLNPKTTAKDEKK